MNHHQLLYLFPTGMTGLATLAVFLFLRLSAAAAMPASADHEGRARLDETYGKVPLSFEANAGQTDPSVKFLSRGSGYSLFLTESEAVLALTKKEKAAPPARPPQEKVSARSPSSSQEFTSAVLRMKLVGARRPEKMTGQEELPGKVN